MAPDCKMTFLYWSSLKSHLGYNVLTDLLLKISLCILELIASLLTGGKKSCKLVILLLLLGELLKSTSFIISILPNGEHFSKTQGNYLNVGLFRSHTQRNILFPHQLRVDALFLNRYSYILKDFFFLTDDPGFSARLWKIPLQSKAAITQPNGFLWSQAILRFWWTLFFLAGYSLCISAVWVEVQIQSMTWRYHSIKKKKFSHLPDGFILEKGYNKSNPTHLDKYVSIHAARGDVCINSLFLIDLFWVVKYRKRVIFFPNLKLAAWKRQLCTRPPKNQPHVCLHDFVDTVP